MTEDPITKKTMVEEQKREFTRIEEFFRSDLALCNKLVLQLGSYQKYKAPLYVFV